MTRLLRLLILASALGVSTASHGALITYNFSGVLTSSFGTLNSGDAFSGSYTVDTSIGPRTGSGSDYAFFDNLTSVSLSIGSFSANIGPGSGLPEIQQDDVAGADRYALVGRYPVASSQMDGLDLILIGFLLDDPTGTAVSDAQVLLTDPMLTDFASNTFFLFFAGPDDADQQFELVTGTIEKLTVPEPATLALLGIGLLGISFLQRRRHASIS